MVSIFPRKNGKLSIHELSLPNHIIAEILLGQHLAVFFGLRSNICLGVFTNNTRGSLTNNHGTI